MQKNEAKAPHAGVARGEQALEPGEQAAGGEQHAFRLRHLRRQLEPRRKARRRDEKLARLGQIAAGAVELPEQALPEAQRDALARQPHQLAEGSDAEAGEQLERLRGEAGHCDRQFLERAAAARRPPQGCARGGRKSEHGLETEVCQTLLELCLQGLEAPKETKTSLHFRHHALRRLERDARRELAGPGGGRRERFPLGLRRRMPARQRLQAKLRKVERDPEHARAFRSGCEAAPRRARRAA